MTVDNLKPQGGEAKHISLFLPHLDAGGSERVMSLLAAGFASRGYHVDLLLGKAMGSYLPDVPESVRVIDLALPNLYAALPKLVRYMRKVKSDVFLSTLDLPNLLALISKRVSATPARVLIRISSAISQQKRTPVKKYAERVLTTHIYPWSDRIIAVSNGVAEDLAKYTGIPLSRISTIYNPVITPDLYKQASAPVNHPWFDPHDIPVILSAGRLTAQKDYSTLIRAFARVREHIQARLVILGEGDEREQLISLVRSLQLDKDVDFPGYFRNPFAYMANSDCFVLSSRWEGLPNALVQSMALGCPLVSTDCLSGPSEILNGGEFGYLVSVGDSEALATAILQTLSGERRLVPEQWLDQFRMDTAIDRYLEVMDLPTGQRNGLSSSSTS